MTYQHHASGPPPGQALDGQASSLPMPQNYGSPRYAHPALSQPYQVVPSGFAPAQSPLYAQPGPALAPPPPENNPHRRPTLPQQPYPHAAHPTHHQLEPSPLTPLPPPVAYPAGAAPQSFGAGGGFDTAYPSQRVTAPAGQYHQHVSNHFAPPYPTPGSAMPTAAARVPKQSIPPPFQRHQVPAPPYAQHLQQPQQQPQQTQQQPLQQPQQASSGPRAVRPGGDIIINTTDMKTRPASQSGISGDQKGRVNSPNAPAARAISRSPALSNSPLSRSPALKKIQPGGVSKATGSSRSPVVSKSPALSHSPAVARSPGTPSQPSIDHPSLLIHVAEECLAKAQEGALQLAVSCSQKGISEYHKLVATGLACLEAAISSKRLPPRVEAKARLRYAGVVVEETEDLMSAETMLTKGIAIADKRLFHDLKYSTQYFLMKVLFRRTPKAALVALNKTINDCDTYKHVYWSYAFRFLKISLLLQSTASSDSAAVLDYCRDITALASKRGDRAVYVFTSLLEGLVHLKSNKTDAVMRVQGCIAQAAKYQLEASAHLPQIEVLLLLLDLACSLRQKSPEPSLSKMRSLQNALEMAYGTSWETSEILLPLVRDATSMPTISTDTGAIVRPGGGDNDFLVVCFMSKADVFSLSYTLCGIAMLYTASVTGDSTSGQAVDARCSESWREALKSLSNFASRKLPREAQMFLQPAMRLARWHSELKCYLFVLLGLTSGTHSEWAEVQRCVDNIDELMDESVDPNIQDLALYLKAICCQGRCNLGEALEIFSSERFTIRHPRGTDADNTIPRELCLMAALNRLWIMASPKHQDEAKVMEIVDQIQGLCESHPDPDIKTVYNLVMASIRTDPPETINQVKRYIQGALNGSQSNRNIQCLSIALSIMRFRLFEGVVGEQALKSAKAASAQAHKVGNLLWKSVAEGMLASSYAMQSQREEYARRYADAVRFANEAAAKSEAVL